MKCACSDCEKVSTIDLPHGLPLPSEKVPLCSEHADAYWAALHSAIVAAVNVVERYEKCHQEQGKPSMADFAYLAMLKSALADVPYWSNEVAT